MLESAAADFLFATLHCQQGSQREVVVGLQFHQVNVDRKVSL
jgi:hypothetical protein